MRDAEHAALFALSAHFPSAHEYPAQLRASKVRIPPALMLAAAQGLRAARAGPSGLVQWLPSAALSGTGGSERPPPTAAACGLCGPRRPFCDGARCPQRSAGHRHPGARARFPSGPVPGPSRVSAPPPVAGGSGRESCVSERASSGFWSGSWNPKEAGPRRGAEPLR